MLCLAWWSTHWPASFRCLIAPFSCLAKRFIDRKVTQTRPAQEAVKVPRVCIVAVFVSVSNWSAVSCQSGRLVWALVLSWSVSHVSHHLTSVKMMSSIKEESLTSPSEASDIPYSHPDFRSPSPPSSNPTSPTPPYLPPMGIPMANSPSATIQLPHSVRQRLDQRSLAQQALLNRTLRNRRHTLANVLRPRWVLPYLTSFSDSRSRTGSLIMPAISGQPGNRVLFAEHTNNSFFIDWRSDQNCHVALWQICGCSCRDSTHVNSFMALCSINNRLALLTTPIRLSNRKQLYSCTRSRSQITNKW